MWLDFSAEINKLKFMNEETSKCDLTRMQFCLTEIHYIQLYLCSATVETGNVPAEPDESLPLDYSGS